MQKETIQFYQNILLSMGHLWGSSKNEELIELYETGINPLKISRQNYLNIKNVSHLWNKLYISMSRDIPTIEELYSDTRDPLIQNLLRITKIAENKSHQKVKAVLSRQDYLYTDQDTFQQTEINLFAPGVWSMTPNVQKFHKALQTLNGQSLELIQDNSLTKIMEEFKQILQIYKLQFIGSVPAILIVARGDSGDKIEQTIIQRQILLQGIKVFRVSFQNLKNTLQYDEKTGKLTLYNRQIGLVYYRQGLLVSDYPNQSCWEVREILQCSRAIKLPDASMQMVNFKKAQGFLVKPQNISKYLNVDQTKIIQQFMTTMWSPQDVKNNRADIAEAYGDRLVIKSMWEGGEKYFKQEAKQKIMEIQPSDYIVMKQISAKVQYGKFLIGHQNVFEGNYVPELGIYGMAIYDDKDVLSSNYISYFARCWVCVQPNDHFSSGIEAISSLAFQ